MESYQEYDCIVIAEMKDKDLGMALMQYPDTTPEDWSAEEIPTDKELVYQVSERSN